MNRTVSCIKCSTPYAPGGHFCHVCGLPHDRPNPGPSLEMLAGNSGLTAGRQPDLMLRPAPTGQRPKRKPSLPLAVLALLFPRAIDE